VFVLPEVWIYHPLIPSIAGTGDTWDTRLRAASVGTADEVLDVFLDVVTGHKKASATWRWCA